MSSSRHPVCPACQTPLRLRIPRSGDLETPCPECHQPLVIAYHDGVLRLSLRSEQATKPSVERRSLRSLLPGRPAWLSPPAIVAALRDPLVVAWVGAGIAAGILGIAFYSASLPLEPRPGMQAETSPREKADPGDVSGAVVEADESSPGGGATPVTAQAKMIPRVAPLPPVAAPRPKAQVPPAVAAPRNRIAIARRGLRQRIVRYALPEPAPFEAVRLEFQELVGVPIRYRDGTEVPQEDVSLTISDTTVAEVLHRLAEQVGMGYRLDEGGIVLVPEGELKGRGN